MKSEDVLQALDFNYLNDELLFNSISIISKYVLEHGPDTRVSLDAIIRLRNLIHERRIENVAIKDAIFSLCREAGLFPYLDDTEISWRDQVACEFFRAPIELRYVFHREQWHAYRLLLEGKNLLLSAPTSFGKSVLIYAYIAEKRPSCVVVIVPTIALLDQFRRKIDELFGGEYKIVTRNDQKLVDKENAIYILTQERLLDRKDIENIDLLVIDEYYKLDSGRERQGEGSRATLLNIALRKYLLKSKQIFFLGPTVAGINMRDGLRDSFTELNLEYSTVAVDIHNHKDAPDPTAKISELLYKYRDDKSLIFSKSPPAARRLIRSLAAAHSFSGHYILDVPDLRWHRKSVSLTRLL